MASSIANAMLLMQAIALLATAITWGRVWECPCDPTIQAAAFWTAVSVAQGVALAGVSIIRPK